MKKITICGSFKFKEEITNIALKLQLEGNIVFTPIFPLNDNIKYKKEELITLGNVHKEKIKLSDAIYVVNINKYIGTSTKEEIELAKSLNKEIIYYE